MNSKIYITILRQWTNKGRISEFEHIRNNESITNEKSFIQERSSRASNVISF